MKVKRILALGGIAVLLGFYVAALIGAIIRKQHLFIMALYATFVVPAVTYALIMLYKWTHKDGAIDKLQADAMLKEAGEKTGEENGGETAENPENEEKGE